MTQEHIEIVAAENTEHVSAEFLLVIGPRHTLKTWVILLNRAQLITGRRQMANLQHVTKCCEQTL